MFAVFKTGGKQYRVAAEDVLKVAKLKGERGEIVEFGEVLVVGGDSVTLGAPTVAGATVAAEVLDQARGPKIIAFKKRRRKNSRRKRGFREEFTLDPHHRDPDRRQEGEQRGAAAAEARSGACGRSREAGETAAAAEGATAKKAKKAPKAKAKAPAARAKPKDKPKGKPKK